MPHDNEPNPKSCEARGAGDSHAVLWIAHVLGCRLWMAVALVVDEVLLAGVSVYSAWVLRELVNAAVDGMSDTLLDNVLVFAAVSVAIVAFQGVRRFLQERARAVYQNALKLRFLDHVVHADLSSVQAVRTGEWMNRLTEDTRVVADGVATVVPSAAGMSVQLMGSLALLSAMVPQIAWLLVPAAVVFAAFTLGFRRMLKRLHKRIRETDGRSRSYLAECLGSLLVVKGFQRESFVEQTASELLEEHRTARMRHNRFSNACNIGFGLAMRGAYLLAVVYCGYGILRGTVSYGSFVGALQLVGQAQGPLANITGCIPRYFAMTASAERLMEAEALPRDDGEGVGSMGRERLEEFAGLELRGVACRYMPADVDGDVIRAAGASGHGDGDATGCVIRCPDMCIKRGEFVAFMGTSGCGKSTTLKAMMAFSPLETGERSVLLSSGRRVPLTAEWRGLFAYVPQGNHLMGGTVREAVVFGAVAGCDCDARVCRALRVACADFAFALPDGLDTKLGEGGTGLSEGQIQRLAIARAVYADRSVLLLDEATSSLDPQTERRVLQNLRRLPDKTVVAVTHRPAALEVCDRRVEFGD